MIASSVAVVATVSLSVTVAVRYVEARCPTCQRRVVDMPEGRLTVRVRGDHTELSGGVAVRCGRCKSLVEVIRHG